MVRSKKLPMREVAVLFSLPLYNDSDIRGDYVLVAKFADSVRDSTNLRALEKEIGQANPNIVPASFTELVSIDGAPFCTFLAVHPMVQLAEVEVLLATIEQEGHLDESAYFANIEPLVQAEWQSASIEDRLALIERAGWDEFDQVLSVTAPSGVWTIIYQDLDD